MSWQPSNNWNEKGSAPPWSPTTLGKSEPLCPAGMGRTCWPPHCSWLTTSGKQTKEKNTRSIPHMLIFGGNVHFLVALAIGPTESNNSYIQTHLFNETPGSQAWSQLRRIYHVKLWQHEDVTRIHSTMKLRYSGTLYSEPKHWPFTEVVKS